MTAPDFEQILGLLRSVAAKQPALFVTKHCPPGCMYIVSGEAMQAIVDNPDLPEKLMALHPSDWESLGDDARALIRGICRVENVS